MCYVTGNPLFFCHTASGIDITNGFTNPDGSIGSRIGDNGEDYFTLYCNMRLEDILK